MLAVMDRLHEWSTRFYRLDPERLAREQGLRADLLRRLLLVAGCEAVLYLALGLASVASGRFFPYDAIELLAVIALCAWMLSRGYAAAAMALPLVVISHTASSIIARYGVASPAPALLLPTIVVCGLLVGGYFLGTWTAICALLVFYIAWVHEVAFRQGDWIPPVVFWSAVFAVMGWLVHLFSTHLERLLQLERGQKHSVLRALGLLTAEQNLEGLHEQTLEVVREQLGARTAALWRWDETSQVLRRVAVAGPAGGSDRVSVADQSAWRGLAESGRGARITGGRDGLGLAGFAGLVAPGSAEALIVPLTVGAAPAGLLVVESDRVPRYAGERVELAEALALLLSLLLELVDLAARRRHAMMVEERNRMARDIHDTLAQGFTGIVVQLNAAEAMLTADTGRAREHIATARELARASLQEARRSVWALRPEAHEHAGLAAALERSARVLTDGTGTELVVHADGEASGLGVDAEWEVLRIGQEAVTNAVRHSGCGRITVRLARIDGSLRLEVEDDGKGGIAPDNGPTGLGSLGLRGMRERAGRLGGRLEVLSPPGGPTRVILVVSSNVGSSG